MVEFAATRLGWFYGIALLVGIPALGGGAGFIFIAVITTPAMAAQKITNDLIDSGVECIMNFAPIKLDVPEHIKVENVDLSHALENLTYFAGSGK